MTDAPWSDHLRERKVEIRGVQRGSINQMLQLFYPGYFIPIMSLSKSLCKPSLKVKCVMFIKIILMDVLSAALLMQVWVTVSGCSFCSQGRMLTYLFFSLFSSLEAASHDAWMGQTGRACTRKNVFKWAEEQKGGRYPSVTWHVISWWLILFVWCV